MTVFIEELRLSTAGEGTMVDITENVQQIVSRSSLSQGIATVFVVGSTGALTTVEFEPGLRKDLPAALDRIAPKTMSYAHHETWHDDNGHSHVKASIVGPSLTLPFREGRLLHGTWQQVVFLELDTSARKRTLVVTCVGDPAP